MTAMEAQDLLFEFGKWARMRPDGWCRCALAHPSRCFYRLTDEEALRIDRVLSGIGKRRPLTVHVLILRYVHSLTVRQIARLTHRSTSAVLRLLEKGLYCFMEEFQSERK